MYVARAEAKRGHVAKYCFDAIAREASTKLVSRSSMCACMYGLAYALYKIISKPSVILITRNYKSKQNGERDHDSLNAYVRSRGMKVGYKRPEQKSQNKVNECLFSTQRIICIT